MSTHGRILVVDDESSLLLTIVANLELEGFDVLQAQSGERALELVKSERIDLVLSDIRMPGMSGVDLFREIRQLSPELPVVLMTAFALESLVASAIHEGAFTVIPKPFDVEHLIAALWTAIRRPWVLVVDDDAPCADTTAAALSASGLKARAVLDGTSALELVAREAVDVCVVDMVMPGLSGPEVMERVLAINPGIACIAISGHDVPGLFRRVSAGVYAFLRKPVEPQALVTTIAQARGRKTLPRPT